MLWLCLLATAPSTSVPAEAARQLPWGLYEILWSPARFGTNLDHNTAELGSPPGYVLFFRDIGRPFPAEVCREIHTRHATPVISLELTEWGAPRSDRLAAINNGQYDAFFRQYAREARSAIEPVYFRFGFEMNGDWFEWGGKPTAFIAAWRRVHRIFAVEGAVNVSWVWAPNAISGPRTPDNGLEKYWPGDAYVDVIGLDGYNFGDDHSPWHRWVSCREIFSDALEHIAASGVTQPVLITGFACADDTAGGRRALWIKNAHAFFTGRPEIIGAIWFNYDKRREGEPNWRIDADSRSLAAWRQTFGAAR